MRGRDKDVVDHKVLAPRATQPHHGPGIDQGRLRDGYQQHTCLQQACSVLTWPVALHDHAGTHEPVRMVDTTRKIPPPLDTIASLHDPRVAFRPQRPGHAHIGRLAKQRPSYLGRKPAQKEGFRHSNHRTPPHGAVRLRQGFDRAKGRQRRHLRPAHGLGQIELKQVSCSQGIDQRRGELACRLDRVARGPNLRCQAPRGGDDIV